LEATDSDSHLNLSYWRLHSVSGLCRIGAVLSAQDGTAADDYALYNKGLYNTVRSPHDPFSLPERGSCKPSMNTKILSALLTIAWFSAAFGQTLDKAKLDQFFDRLAEKNQAMGTLTIAKDGNVLYRSAAALEATATDKFQLAGGRIVFEFDAAKEQMTVKRRGRERVFTKEK
jgi:hypothetical protein